MRTPRIFAMALLLVAALTAAACQLDTAESKVDPVYHIEQAPRADMPEELQRLLDDGGRLTIGAKFDQPLTGMRNEATGRIEGFDAEIGRIIAQRLFGPDRLAEGENFDFVETPSHKREEYLRDGTVDLVVGTYTVNEKREREVDFAGPYYKAGQAIMTRKDSKIDDVGDLSGKKVCVAENTTSMDNVKRENPKAEQKLMRNWSACNKALLDSQVDAVSTDNSILYGFADERPDVLRVSEDTFTEEPYGVGLPQDSPEMVDFVNGALQAAFEDGDWQLAFERTLGASDVPAPEGPPKLTTN